MNSVKGIERPQQGCDAGPATSPEVAAERGARPRAGQSVQGEPLRRAGAAVERVERTLKQPSRAPIVSGDGHLQGYNQMGIV